MMLEGMANKRKKESRLQPGRLWGGRSFRGEEGYLMRQRRYELARTILLFLIALGIFLLGFLSTGTTSNLLSVVAALGCLPASRSAVSTIMYFRYKGCPRERAELLGKYRAPRGCRYLYDMVFTTYDKNYELDHIAVCGRNIRMLAHGGHSKNTDPVGHLTEALKKDGIGDVSIKVFYEFSKYERLLQNISEEAENEKITEAVISTLKSISL